MSIDTKRSGDSGGMRFRLFRYPSALMFIVCAAVLLFSHLTSAFVREEVYKGSAPVPSFISWLTDLNAYHSRFAAYPPSLLELERDVWRPNWQKKGDTSPTSVLEHGTRMYLHDNYAYIYQRDIANTSVCSLWAVPQGERMNEGNTHFLLITPTSTTAWRGATLTPEQIHGIPTAARPTGEDMARLGMFKQKDVPDTKSKWSFLRFLNR